tara:strand:- start:669 stop:1175 length:507 start_codon:yes stop_codon:yes gene_type:complete
MEPFTLFLLSMQAAGVVTSLWSSQGAQKQIQQGRAMEKAGIEMNMAANNYEFEESSLASMKALRQNLGTQAVMQAARGVGTGTELTVGKVQDSISSQKGDQEARRMRMLSREAELRASNVLSGLHTMQSETQLGQSLSKDLFEVASTGIRQFEGESQNALSSKFGFGK